MSRMYAPYWSKLKQDKCLEVICNSNSVQTIKRMIMKEKDIDTMFKLENNENNMAWIINSCTAPVGPGKTKITFSMKLKSTSI